MSESGTAGQRHHQLLAIKLRALVRDHLGTDVEATPVDIGDGAALVHDGRAWVLADTRPERALGPALAWALRAGATSVDVLAGSATGTLTRRAGAFRFPIEAWHVDDRVLLPAVAEPLPVPPPAPSEHEALIPLIVEGGAEPLVEHGVVTGEVRGLEVCRVVTSASTGAVQLEVGVGAHDRQAFQMLHGDVPPRQALAGVVEAVAAHRAGGPAGHPLGRLAAERLLRWRIVDDPSLAGLRSALVVPPPLPRPNVKDPVPCVARALDADGRPCTVVFSAGVDLDVVPYAVDARALAPGDPVLIVVPARDLLAIQRELAALLREPVLFLGL